MPNVTISVPDELKAEMDKFAEVSWSEVCRNAISQYIAQRKNPTPKIELDLRNARLYDRGFETGYPTLSVDLRIHNKMDSEITVDRILFNARFIREDGYQPAVGLGADLYKRIIGASSVGGSTIDLVIPKEKIELLQREFQSTFYCDIKCVVFVEGFKQPYNQGVKTTIPIDHWNSVVKKVLTPHQATQA